MVPATANKRIKEHLMLKPYITIPLGLLLWALVIAHCFKPAPKPYTKDLSKTPDILTLGEDIYEGFPVAPYIDKEYECFLRAVYNEAYSEGVAGQQAVAQVLYNRYISREFPEDMCLIIGQRQGRVYQFPWMRERNKRELVLEQHVIEEMSEYLASIYMGVYTVPKLERATYFKRCDVPNDVWWKSLTVAAKIGDHCFYNTKAKP